MRAGRGSGRCHLRRSDGGGCWLGLSLSLRSGRWGIQGGVDVGGRCSLRELGCSKCTGQRGICRPHWHETRGVGVSWVGLKLAKHVGLPRRTHYERPLAEAPVYWFQASALEWLSVWPLAGVEGSPRYHWYWRAEEMVCSIAVCHSRRL